MNFLELIWLMIGSFIYISYLIVLFQIVRDVFADSMRPGWSKALWVLLLVFLPIIGGLAYLIAHGQSMSLRQAARADVAKEDFDDYVRRTARPNAAEEISVAKALMDDGVLTAEEFAVLKERALRH